LNIYLTDETGTVAKSSTGRASDVTLDQDFLQRTKASSKGVSELVRTGDGSPYVRGLNPIPVEQKCLACHSMKEGEAAGYLGMDTWARKDFSELSTGSQALAQGASTRASSAREVSSALQEMSSMTRQNASNATEAAKSTSALIEESVQNAENGVSINHEVLENLTEINDQVNKVTQQTAANAEQSASAAEELASQAEEMKGTIHTFSLTEAEGTLSNIPESVLSTRRPYGARTGGRNPRLLPYKSGPREEAPKPKEGLNGGNESWARMCRP